MNDTSQNSSFSPLLLGNGWTNYFVWKAMTWLCRIKDHSLFVTVVNSVASHKADLIDTKFHKPLRIFLQTMKGSKKINSNLKVDRLAKSFNLCLFQPFLRFTTIFFCSYNCKRVLCVSLSWIDLILGVLLSVLQFRPFISQSKTVFEYSRYFDDVIVACNDVITIFHVYILVVLINTFHLSIMMVGLLLNWKLLIMTSSMTSSNFEFLFFPIFFKNYKPVL